MGDSLRELWDTPTGRPESARRFVRIARIVIGAITLASVLGGLLLVVVLMNQGADAGAAIALLVLALTLTAATVVPMGILHLIALGTEQQMRLWKIELALVSSGNVATDDPIDGGGES